MLAIPIMTNLDRGSEYGPEEMGKKLHEAVLRFDSFHMKEIDEIRRLIKDGNLPNLTYEQARHCADWTGDALLVDGKSYFMHGKEAAVVLEMAKNLGADAVLKELDEAERKVVEVKKIIENDKAKRSSEQRTDTQVTTTESEDSLSEAATPKLGEKIRDTAKAFFQKAQRQGQEIFERKFDDPVKELKRQFDIVTQEQYAKAAGMELKEYRVIFEPLKARIQEIAEIQKEMPEGHLPFVIVISDELISVEKQMALTEIYVDSGDKKTYRNGYTSLIPEAIKEFKPFNVNVPDEKAYLALDIEIGKDTLNESPDEAIEKIKGLGRSPLTLEEGVALLTHHPEVFNFKDKSSAWMPGSRRGDREIPRIMPQGGGAKLSSGQSTESDRYFGSPSCKSRIAGV